MSEQWRCIPGAPGYEASNEGRIRSLDRTIERTNGRPYHVRQRVLRTTVAPSGHLRVSLHVDDQRLARLVHQLVLEAFIGPRPVGLVSRHLDDDPTNNALSNLRWGTHRENQCDRVRNGRDPNASKTHCVNRHLFDASNTRIAPDGHRSCRECARDATRRYRSRRAA